MQVLSRGISRLTLAFCYCDVHKLLAQEIPGDRSTPSPTDHEMDDAEAAVLAVPRARPESCGGVVPPPLCVYIKLDDCGTEFLPPKPCAQHVLTGVDRS